MTPISAAMAEPTRPATRKLVITGPSSLTMERPTIAPIMSWVPYFCSSDPVWRANTMPTKNAMTDATGRVS